MPECVAVGLVCGLQMHPAGTSYLLTIRSDSLTIYLLRHAIAENRAASGVDRDRALTPDGIAKLNIVLRVAAKAGMDPAMILASPYRRTVETADVAHRIFNVEQDVVLSDALTPDASPRRAWDEMRIWHEDAPLLVVTHEPLVSGLFSFLLGSSAQIHEFKKSGIARIDIHRVSAQPGCMLRWLLTPALAAAIALETGD